MLEESFHEIVSGRRRGLGASIVRAVLWPAQLPYGMAVAWRNRRYDTYPDAVSHAGVPVISVGNLTVGGTGKTPMVKWIARFLREKGVRVALLSRGYGAEHGAVNDEAIELEQALPDVPHLQDPDRVASARIAVEELESQLLLLDDGFQHRRLARDLDIVLLDATQPFGHGHLLPRGLLREPIRSLRRAQVVCLTRADMADERTRTRVRQQVERHAPQAAWCEASHRPSRLLNSAGGELQLSEARGKRASAFCGIGNPQAFNRTLESMGIEHAILRLFPDHHPYSRSDIALLAEDAQQAEMAVCTMKDLAKIQSTHLGETPLWGVEIEMAVSEGRAELEERLNQLAELAREANA